MLKAIPVFYCTEMVAKIDSRSPSAHKAKDLVELWIAQEQPIEIRTPAPVSSQDFFRVHDPDFVMSVLSLDERNGFNDFSEELIDSLPFTSGAMLDAAKEAIENGRVAVAPCSGFHHAGYRRCGGFCTFNGLLVAAAVLKDARICNSVAILDCDRHYGDGTDEIIAHLGLTWVKHYSVGKHFWAESSAEAFLGSLSDIICGFEGCDVVLYQAGADPHVDDPLGGWLTTEQMIRRDRIVFETLSDMRLPVAWNLAGGYQTPLSRVLQLHTNTLESCIEVHLR